MEGFTDLSPATQKTTVKGRQVTRTQSPTPCQSASLHWYVHGYVKARTNKNWWKILFADRTTPPLTMTFVPVTNNNDRKTLSLFARLAAFRKCPANPNKHYNHTLQRYNQSPWTGASAHRCRWVSVSMPTKHFNYNTRPAIVALEFGSNTQRNVGRIECFCNYIKDPIAWPHPYYTAVWRVMHAKGRRVGHRQTRRQLLQCVHNGE